MKRLCISGQIRPKAAKHLLDEVIKFGEWVPIPGVTGELLQQTGPTYEATVEHATNILRPVPNFENLSGPTWTASPGVEVRRDNADGTSTLLGAVQDASGGVITLRTYHAKFRAACELLISAPTSSDVFEVLLSAISKALPSIDSLIIDLAMEWNCSHTERAPIDIAERQLNTEEHIDQWIPVITGARFDKSTRHWQAYKMLLVQRHEWDQHPKQTGSAKSFRELAELGNLFFPGIAGVLFDLHLIADRKVPVDIIRFKHFPGFYIC